MEITSGKPCPFCGQLHEWETVVDIHWGEHLAKVCVKGMTLLEVYPDQDIKPFDDFWNTRPLEDALRRRALAAEGKQIELERLLESANNEMECLKDTYDALAFYKDKADGAAKLLQQIDELSDHINHKIDMILGDNPTPWKDVTKELPTNDLAERFFVLTNGYYAQIAVYSARMPNVWTVGSRDISPYVTHWMNIPANPIASSNEEYWRWLGKGIEREEENYE